MVLISLVCPLILAAAGHIRTGHTRTGHIRTGGPRELAAYLALPDRSFKYSVDKNEGTTTTLGMTSQVWQGVTWRHQILYSLPEHPARSGTAILYITGDGPRPGDYADIALMSHSTGMPIAMLFDEPNQPLWGLREDELIARTFQNYIETGDASWPLLFPMTKAEIRAMDAIQDLTKETPNPISHFVVTGASKRGWTTWMAAASGDSRILGVAPMVYDNLNIPAQMPHQLSSWGTYSEMIEAYTKLGLQSQLSTQRGKQLARMVDPFSYRDSFRVPILVVKGSNDPYWTADATSLYFNALKPPHWLFTVPNAGHTLNGGFLAAQTIGAFARSVCGDFPFPAMSPVFRVSTRNGHTVATFTFEHPTSSVRLRPYMATSNSTDFRKSKYEVPKPIEQTLNRVSFEVPKGVNAAVFLEADFKTPDGKEFGLSTPIRILRALKSTRSSAVNDGSEVHRDQLSVQN